MYRRLLGLTVLALLLPLAGLAAQEGSAGEPGVVEVTAKEYNFRLAPAEIPSGWVTVRLQNQGERPHMLELARIAKGRTPEDYQAAVDTMRRVIRQLEAGTIDSAEAEQRYPEWFGEWLRNADYAGGHGPMSPGNGARLTLRLEPLRARHGPPAYCY